MRNELHELIKICSSAAKKSGLTKERSEQLLKQVREKIRKEKK